MDERGRSSATVSREQRQRRTRNGVRSALASLPACVFAGRRSVWELAFYWSEGGVVQREVRSKMGTRG
ncbi:unnamed protein product [Linum trigynum]|uniref:Uncharacterized protein n=1 Tax=Linum trigynum TaxID=586398 RepID=A0AAV2CGM8_9ROSI